MQALRNPALEKVEKKLAGKTEEPAGEKRSSVKDKLQTTSFAQKSFVLPFLQKIGRPVRALEKGNGNLDWQIRGVGLQNVEVRTVGDDRKSPDVKLAELDVPKVQVAWVV